MNKRRRLKKFAGRPDTPLTGRACTPFKGNVHQDSEPEVVNNIKENEVIEIEAPYSRRHLLMDADEDEKDQHLLLDVDEKD
ncbi:hypothetical protein LR48_Vigan197s001600 [Vigna angularis]|uniref:Uncharacterized protein n=1 Tax=Phaseolus angularis TaxID=3914 RepID=A0A0L9T5I8_PHAAN|nr:hypothetical protein LR48_Vigan197s001600 [Vigna angularis]